MSDLGGMLFDRDAVYIDLPDWKVGAVDTFMRFLAAVTSGLRGFVVRVFGARYPTRSG
jgi:hypothetical protein